jgi:hypothetical protein
MVKTTKPLTVYGTYGLWHDVRNKIWTHEATFVVASTSKAAILRAYPELAKNTWTKTVNELELYSALKKPMSLFVRGAYDWNAPFVEVEDLNTVRRS